MSNKDSGRGVGALHAGEPSPWVIAQSRHLPRGKVLDLACGRGRHARWLAAQGWRVLAADRDAAALGELSNVAGVTTVCCDLEAAQWPLAGQVFDGVVVTNYLHRPNLPQLASLLRAGGVVIYETFMQGNERFGRPSNPDFLLAPDELKQWAQAYGLEVLAFEQGEQRAPRMACVQRICARGPIDEAML